MWMSVVSAADSGLVCRWVSTLPPWGHFGVHSLGCLQGLCLGLWSYCSERLFLWSVLSLAWHDPCSHWLWRARRLLLLWGKDMESFCNKHYLPTSPQSNCIDRKPSKRSLKKCDGVLKCGSLQFIDSGGVQEERIQFCLRSFPCSSEWGNFFLIFLFLFMFFTFFLRVRSQGWGADKKRLGSECDWGAWCEIPR